MTAYCIFPIFVPFSFVFAIAVRKVTKRVYGFLQTETSRKTLIRLSVEDGQDVAHMDLSRNGGSDF